MEVKLEEQKKQSTVYIKKITTMKDLPLLLNKTFNQVFVYLKNIGIKPLGGPYTAYFGFDKNAVNVNMGWLVSKELPDEGVIKSGKTIKGKAAVAIHKGPYGKLMDTYKKIDEWIAENRLISDDITYEYYLNSPKDVPSSELLTKVVVFNPLMSLMASECFASFLISISFSFSAIDFSCFFAFSV